MAVILSTAESAEPLDHSTSQSSAVLGRKPVPATVNRRVVESTKRRPKGTGAVWTFTQAELARTLDVKTNTVYRWEAGILPITRVVELAVRSLPTGKKHR